jgi:serine/threonine protein kinase
MSFGKVIGDYELVGKINKGGIAEIHKARHRGNGSVYALRIMLPEIVKTSRNIRLFLGGAEIVREVNHPNIVRVLDVLLDKEMPCVVMEYVEGNNLKHYLVHNDPVVTEKPFEILMQLACGIQHLHASRILHRDIKPENILISEKMEVKIADFSLAVRIGKGPLISKVICGSKSYIAPERILLSRYDERADIYSMGITAYELLTGRLPYTGASDQEVLYKHVNPHVRPPAIRRLNPSVPAELERIVLTCMRKDPARRYPDVGLIIRDLEKARLSSGRRG